MSEASIVLPTFGPQEWKILWFVLGSAFIALGYGVYLARKTIAEDPGSQAMQEVALAIEEGAFAYLARQVKTMIWFVIAITIGLFFMYRGIYEGMLLPLGVSLAFFMGVAASYGAGYVGMWLAVKGNVRTAAAALHSFKSALEIAFRAGTVSGMFTVGLGLLGATIIFLLFKENAMKILIGFGFGGSLAALFMRMGGGIFTKAADVGADLVGKVEKGIPEDDPRNPATIADNVGDNVGDCAGMAADVFESYEVTLVAAIILGAGAMLDKDFVESFGGAASASKVVLALVIYPLLIRAVGVFGSIFGTWCVRGKEDPAMNPMKPITFGFWMAALSSIVGFWLVSYFYLGDIVSPKYGAIWWRVFLANVMGIGLALVIEWLTGYFTAVEKKPVTEIAYASRTGPATLILSGIASGLESSVWAVLAIVATIYGSYSIFGGSYSLSAYGIALAGLGLLATTGFILAEDTFGPISDNANGIFEMSGALKNNPRTPSGIEAHRIVAKLDAVGNTTKALTKGLAIATAVLAAVALFRSFIDEAHLIGTGIQVNLPEVFIGLLIGGAVPFLFSSFAIQAVSRAAFLLVEEVRRQFREKPGIMEFKEKPDYGRCVEIVTAAAQKELIGPAILSIVSPILVAFAFGAAALGGFLAGAILTGQLMAVFLSNTGGAWDNAKKKIEEGLFGGKGTDCHKAAVIGDTVGDPFKDTAGPAINPMIKVMNLVAILIAPLAIREIGGGTRFLIFLACVIVLGISVAFSKRGSIVGKEQAAALKAEAKKAH
ncbi:MAG: hppA [candidate division NC10 bacterium]|nr:hppA [candidate division NC10 bacterium]